LQVALTFSDNDDRVVHDDPHGEHQSNSGKVVQHIPSGRDTKNVPISGLVSAMTGMIEGAPFLQKQEDDANKSKIETKNRDDHLLDDLLIKVVAIAPPPPPPP